MVCFEKRVLRRIYGPIVENGMYRRRTNREIEQIYQKLSINVYLMSKRIKLCMEVIFKKVLEGKIIGKKYLGVVLDRAGQTGSTITYTSAPGSNNNRQYG